MSQVSRVFGIIVSVISLGWAGTALGQPAESPTLANYQNWQGLWNFLRQENDPPGTGRPLGSRDPGLCLVSPGDHQMLWHRNPVFVWQGDTFTTGVRPTQAVDNILWQATVDEEDSGVYRARYQGAPLEAGTHYDWVFYGSILNPNAISEWFYFQLMDVDRYEHHAAELAVLQHELEADGANEEAIALARADYFLTNDLPNDAVQAMFSVDTPSAELQAVQSDLVEKICSGSTDLTVPHLAE
ncbi:MAG: hypothetical protein ACFBSF_09660 [Leptolyngbyaceae cyanobacterium]